MLDNVEVGWTERRDANRTAAREFAHTLPEFGAGRGRGTVLLLAPGDAGMSRRQTAPQKLSPQ